MQALTANAFGVASTGAVVSRGRCSGAKVVSCRASAAPRPVKRWSLVALAGRAPGSVGATPVKPSVGAVLGRSFTASASLRDAFSAPAVRRSRGVRGAVKCNAAAAAEQR